MTVPPRHFASVPSTVAAVDGDAVRAKPVSALLDIPLDALDGSEIIIFAIKPSMWSPVFESFGWLCAAAALAIVCLTAGVGLTGASSQVSAQIVLGIGAVRLGVAIVRWVSSWYILTNRRIVEVTGVRSPRVTSASLVDIRNTYLTSAVHEKAFHLGTVAFIATRGTDRPWYWKHLREPEDVHAAIRRAIENAIDSMPRSM